MIKLTIKNEELEIDSNNPVVIQTEYPNLFIKELKHSLSNNKKIIFDSREYKDFFLISELTTIDELLNLNRSCGFNLKISTNINELKEIINHVKINEFIEKYNKILHCEYFQQNEDQNKFLNAIINLNKNCFVNNENIYSILQLISKNEKSLIVLNSFSKLDINRILELSNNYNFLIITQDLRTVIPNIQYLELVCFYNLKLNSLIHLEDTNKLMNYLELKINYPINDLIINKYLSGDLNEINAKIYFFLSKIS